MVERVFVVHWIQQHGFLVLHFLSALCSCYICSVLCVCVPCALCCASAACALCFVLCAFSACVLCFMFVRHVFLSFFCLLDILVLSVL